MALIIHQVRRTSNFDSIVDIDGVSYGIIGAKKELNIVKFGYSCEPSGTADKYPIYLNCGDNPNSDTRIYIASSGIYEASYEDAANEENRLHINSFAVPLDIHFVCDYVVSTN